MSALLAFFLTQAAPVAPDAVDAEIVVLAQKLKNTRFVWKARDTSGSWKLKSYKIKQTSGDKAVDAITCRAFEICLPMMPKGTKQAPPEFNACVSDQRNGMIEALARQRAKELDALQ